MKHGLILDVNNNKWWYQNGQLHREDGPAIEFMSGSKQWCQNGRLHREDGPAIDRINGTKEWWFEGIRCTEDDPRVNCVKYANLKRALKPVAFEKL